MENYENIVEELCYTKWKVWKH